MNESKDIVLYSVKQLDSVIGNRPTFLLLEWKDSSSDSSGELLLCSLAEVDDVIDKLIIARNRAWPFPAYTVPA